MLLSSYIEHLKPYCLFCNLCIINLFKFKFISHRAILSGKVLFLYKFNLDLNITPLKLFHVVSISYHGDPTRLDSRHFCDTKNPCIQLQQPITPLGLRRSRIVDRQVQSMKILTKTLSISVNILKSFEMLFIPI